MNLRVDTIVKIQKTVHFVDFSIGLSAPYLATAKYERNMQIRK